MPAIDGHVRVSGGKAYVESWDKTLVHEMQACLWVPYQRPSFVTPPFAGYVSGHSTFSRAAADTMTYITGNPFFPGGLATFVARASKS